MKKGEIAIVFVVAAIACLGLGFWLCCERIEQPNTKFESFQGSYVGGKLFSTFYDGEAVYYAVQSKAKSNTATAEIYRYDLTTGRAQKLHTAALAGKKIICCKNGKIYCYDKKQNSWSVKPRVLNHFNDFDI